jgi:hypothetical protein
MKTFSRIAAQGELRFMKITPMDTKNLKRIDAQGDHLVVGHSETGHHHVMDPVKTTMYKLPDSILDCLLVVEQEDTLRHLRSFDTHEPLVFTPGTYRVTTAREYTPEGWRRSQD